MYLRVPSKKRRIGDASLAFVRPGALESSQQRCQLQRRTSDRTAPQAGGSAGHCGRKSEKYETEDIGRGARRREARTMCAR